MKNKFKILLSIFIIFLVTIISIYFFPNKTKKTENITTNSSIIEGKITENKISEIIDFEKSIEIIKNRAWVAESLEWIETELKEEDFKLAWNTDENLDFWIKDLPKNDKKSDSFIIIPRVGLVMPLWSITEDHKDYKDFANWIDIDLNKYFKNGAFLLPATSLNDFWEIWNKVISAHSSYFKNDDGRYKTHFQKIILLEENDEIWIYKKNKQGNFDMYKYVTKLAYNTDDKDINILKPSDKKLLTLFTCTPIWGLTWRWVVRAELKE